MKAKLWTKNFTLVTVASALGGIGGIAGGFALSFLVFDETGSTLASALILAIQCVPYFLLPMIAAPIMDRVPRKPVLVGGDLVNGVLYALMGLYLMFAEFSYVGYLCYSLLLASISSMDQLAYSSIYPQLIPQGMEQKGYAISSTLYPVLKVIMTPFSAVLLDLIGVAWLLVGQGGLSLLAALIESRIDITEQRRDSQGFSFKAWWGDIREAAAYLKAEKGIMNIYSYMAATNGVAAGYSSVLVAFFRTAPGMTAAMYSMFSVMEFAGRTLGGMVQYKVEIPKKKRYSFTLLVYIIYELMDMCLLWIPYPLMLANRACCGFLGTNSATVRSAAVQRYIPEKLRARVNAFQDVLITAAQSLMSLVVGALGEMVSYAWCLTIFGGLTLAAVWFFIWRGRQEIKMVYEQ